MLFLLDHVLFSEKLTLPLKERVESPQPKNLQRFALLRVQKFPLYNNRNCQPDYQGNKLITEIQLITVAIHNYNKNTIFNIKSNTAKH